MVNNNNIIIIIIISMLLLILSLQFQMVTSSQVIYGLQDILVPMTMVGEFSLSLSLSLSLLWYKNINFFPKFNHQLSPFTLFQFQQKSSNISGNPMGTLV